jgi:hypothetical protein
MGLGRLTHPISGSIRAPFDLAASRNSYSPLAKSHASTHSPFAAEEQRGERHHSKEERVELVVYGFPSQRGNLVRNTTLEFQQL